MNDIKEFTNIYITYNNINIKDKLRDIINSKTSYNERFKQIQKLMLENKKEFSKLKQLIINNSNLISSEKAVELSNEIDHIIDSLGAIDNDINDILVSLTSENIQKMQSHIDQYNEFATSLASIMLDSLDKYQESLYFAVSTGALTLDDLSKLSKEAGLQEEQKVAIAKVINQLQKEHKLTDNKMDLAEQASIEDKKGKVSDSSVNDMSDVIDENVNGVKGLDERLNSVQYNQDSFYGADISQVRIEYEIEQLNKRITSLKEAKKLSFKEAIELHSLVAQVEQLNEMLFNIELNKRDLKREEKLDHIDSKISSKENAILEEKTRQEHSNSKLFRYISARKEKKLTKKVTELKKQMGMIEAKQCQSVLLRFDKANNKLMKKTKRQAVKRVIATTTKENIQKLKEFKNRVVEETVNITTDLKNRFVHKKEVVNDMRNKEVIMTGQPVEIVILENPSMSMQM